MNDGRRHLRALCDRGIRKPRGHDMERLRLLLGHPGGPGVDPGEATWRRFHTHELNRIQAGISHMPRDFRFVVVAEPVNFCVEAVEAFDRQGNLLSDEPVPCEH